MSQLHWQFGKTTFHFTFDFIDGYRQGYTNFQQAYGDLGINDGVLFAEVSQGIYSYHHSQRWNTGYVAGLHAALYGVESLWNQLESKGQVSQ